jgi:hypothetical protein
MMSLTKKFIIQGETMKRNKILITSIAIILMFSLSACGSGGLKGTYKYQENYYLIFSGSNKVEWHESIAK